MERLIPFVRRNAAFLAAGFLLTFASSFGQTFFISIFAGEIRAFYGLSHAGWGGSYMVATLASAAVMVWLGTVTDRVRVRVLGVLILLGLAAAALLMASARHVVVLIVAVFFLRLMGQGMMGHVAMVAMGRWFVAARGRAVSLAGLGVSLGEATLPLVFVGLMVWVEWRVLWVIAAVVLVILVPVLARLLALERTPQSLAAEVGATGMGGRMWSRGDMLRSPVFWAMVPMIVGPSAWNTSFFFHQVHLAEVKGWGHGTLVAMFPLFTVASIGTMLVTGWFADRFGAGRLVWWCLLPCAVGYALWAGTGSVWAATLGTLCIGASQGANNTLTGTFWAEYFGTAHLGAIRSVTTALMVLGSAVGPGITGLLIDAGLAFDQQGWGIAAFYVGASVLAGVVVGRRAYLPS